MPNNMQSKVHPPAMAKLFHNPRTKPPPKIVWMYASNVGSKMRGGGDAKVNRGGFRLRRANHSRGKQNNKTANHITIDSKIDRPLDLDIAIHSPDQDLTPYQRDKQNYEGKGRTVAHFEELQGLLP